MFNLWTSIKNTTTKINKTTIFKESNNGNTQHNDKDCIAESLKIKDTIWITNTMTTFSLHKMQMYSKNKD